MRFRIGRYTKNILLNHVFNNYGQFLNEISLIDGEEDVKGKIMEIIRKYSAGMFKDHDLELRSSSKDHLDYILILKKKRYNKQNNT